MTAHKKMYYRICPEHGRHLHTCRVCRPHQALVASLRKSVRGALLRGGASKTQRTLSYLGVRSWHEVVAIIQKKIAAYKRTHRVKIQGMDFHLDHIKPVAAFRGKNMRACCHITNLQPLPRGVNLHKSGRWSAEAEAYWRRHIIFNRGFTGIFLP